MFTNADNRSGTIIAPVNWKQLSVDQGLSVTEAKNEIDLSVSRTLPILRMIGD